MTDFAVSVEQLSKSYRIGTRKSPQAETLVGQLAAWAMAPYHQITGKSAPAPAASAIHWALKDVNFQINEGESVGIIGHNGAGKSTLLKILSRITHPTAGAALVRGRMASLLEVGTGFHPDLTGRDNVYMNAAILGMSRQQINRRFDEIVQFSGVEEYIETPIKHYSSGMKVRLAFAVAAHLDPDVLVIDEVLAVGDAEFQKKCLNRIEAVGTSGRTTLFVSHNLAAVARLCKRTLILDRGSVLFDGNTLEAIRLYEERFGTVRSRTWAEPALQPGDAVARLSHLDLLADDQPVTGPINSRCKVSVRLRYAISGAERLIIPSLHLFDAGGTAVLSALDTSERWHHRPRPAGNYETRVTIPGYLLNEGTFSVSVAISSAQPQATHVWVNDAVQFRVYDSIESDGPLGRHGVGMGGYFRPILDWQTQAI